MAIEETLYKAGKGYLNMIFLTVGTGIGGVAVIDGKLFIGFANRAMELRHVPQRVVIEVGLCEAGEFYIQKVRKKVFHYSIPVRAANSEVIYFILVNKVVCISAASFFSKFE